MEFSGAAIGGFALYKLFNRGKDLKRLKKASQSEWGIDVKDKGVLKQMKKVSGAIIGKVSNQEKATEAVRIPENKELLRIHAEGTGQDTSRIDRDRITDENFEGNQFTGKFGGYRREGGEVKSGYTYGVGEEGFEWFTPKMDGFITPNNEISKVCGKYKKRRTYSRNKNATKFN